MTLWYELKTKKTELSVEEFLEKSLIKSNKQILASLSNSCKKATKAHQNVVICDYRIWW